MQISYVFISEKNNNDNMHFLSICTQNIELMFLRDCELYFFSLTNLSVYCINEHVTNQINDRNLVKQFPVYNDIKFIL